MATCVCVPAHKLGKTTRMLGYFVTADRTHVKQIIINRRASADSTHSTRWEYSRSTAQYSPRLESHCARPVETGHSPKISGALPYFSGA